MNPLKIIQGIVLRSFGEPPTLAPDAIELKVRTIAQSMKIKEVKSLPMEELAVESLAQLQTLEREMEKCRKTIKEKPLEICKQIDGLARDYTESLAIEIKRLKGILGTYAEIKRQEALAEERKRQEEIRKAQEAQRLEEEKIARAAQAQAAAEIERQKQLEAANNAKTQKARDEANRLAEEARKTAEAESLRLAQAATAAQAKEDEIRTSLPIVAPKAAGAATKFVWKYEVTNISDLFAHFPHVVELVEKKSAVNMLINSMVLGKPEQIPNIPGLRVYREAEVNARSLVRR